MSELKAGIYGFFKSIYLDWASSHLYRTANKTKTLYGIDSPEYAKIVGKIGLLNYKWQNYSNAIPFNQLSVDIYEDTGSTEVESYAQCLYNLGITYLELSNYNNAAKFLNKALKSVELQYGLFSVKYIKYLNAVTLKFETYKNKKSKILELNKDFSEINKELSKLYIDCCEISKEKNGLLNPRTLKYLEKLKSVSSYKIIEPYYYEVMGLFHRNGDFEREKFYQKDMENIKNKSDNKYDNDIIVYYYKRRSEIGPEGEVGYPIPENYYTDEIFSDELNSQIKCSLFSVPEASPGDDILIQVLTHYLEKTEEAFKLAKEFDKVASLRQSKTFNADVRKNSIFTFEIEIKDLPIEDPIQQLTWKGVTESVQFIITIPENYSKQSLIGKVRVALGNVPIGHFCFKISISANVGLKKDNSLSDFSQMRNYRYAFISYATQDRAEVLRRVQMLDLLKIRYFQDILTLNPGDLWEKELFKQIDIADVFFLFWSTAARDSEWVLKEVEYAISKKKGNDDNPPEIYPVILENTFVEPPNSLKHLHFSDKIVFFI